MNRNLSVVVNYLVVKLELETFQVQVLANFVKSLLFELKMVILSDLSSLSLRLKQLAHLVNLSVVIGLAIKE